MLYELPSKPALVFFLDILVHVLWNGADQCCEGELVRSPALHSVVETNCADTHRELQEPLHGDLPVVGEEGESTSLLALLLDAFGQRITVHSLVDVPSSPQHHSRQACQQCLQRGHVIQRVRTPLSPVNRGHVHSISGRPQGQSHQYPLVVPAALALDPLVKWRRVLLVKDLPHLVHVILCDAQEVDEQAVGGPEALHSALQRRRPHSRRRPHAGQQGLLVIPASVVANIRQHIALEELVVPLDQRQALKLREVRHEGDQPGVVGAPALDAVSYRRGQPLRRRLHQELHQRLEIAVAEDALAKRRALLGQLLLQALASLGFVCRCQLLELRRCLGRQLPGDRLKIGVGTSK
mmetsp:Transcript_3376/g.8251  ORF Transcript_3376/g.8251 Transcript_3376/m.8251 type:complete len:351 (-) Transcript_3376:1121-2173(-)